MISVKSHYRRSSWFNYFFSRGVLPNYWATHFANLLAAITFVKVRRGILRCQVLLQFFIYIFYFGFIFSLFFVCKYKRLVQIFRGFIHVKGAFRGKVVSFKILKFWLLFCLDKWIPLTRTVKWYIFVLIGLTLLMFLHYEAIFPIFINFKWIPMWILPCFTHFLIILRWIWFLWTTQASNFSLITQIRRHFRLLFDMKSLILINLQLLLLKLIFLDL